MGPYEGYLGLLCNPKFLHGPPVPFKGAVRGWFRVDIDTRWVVSINWGVLFVGVLITRALFLE